MCVSIFNIQLSVFNSKQMLPMPLSKMNFYKYNTRSLIQSKKLTTADIITRDRLLHYMLQVFANYHHILKVKK